MAERVILAAKDVDVNDLNFRIQQPLPGALVPHKLIDAVCNAKGSVISQQDFGTHWICQTCHRFIYNLKLDLRLFYFDI